MSENPVVKPAVAALDARSIDLDFTSVRNTPQLHQYLAQVFGFPSFYGANAHALIDCLSSLRLPEDPMTGWTLEPHQALVVNVRNLFSTPREVSNDFLVAMGAVNNKCRAMGQPPLVYLMLHG